MNEDIPQRTVNFKTLGCRLNIAESDALAARFRQLGFTIVPFHETADVTVLNTCTVTDKADSKNRYYIRKAAREAGNFTVVTGCYAQTDPEDIRQMTGVDLVVDNRHKGRLPELIDQGWRDNRPVLSPEPVQSQANGNGTAGANYAAENWRVSLPEGHTRAYLKVQDGCNKSCSYCKIPRARGRARSAPVNILLSNLRELRERGIPEIVLSGINLGWYRIDPTKNIKSLPALLARFRAEISDTRLRISSIEPGDITPALLEEVTRHRRFTPFFHVPVQAGSNRILKRMRRGYNRENFLRRVERIRSAFLDSAQSPGDGEEVKEGAKDQLVDLRDLPSWQTPAVGTDLIIGFPGETEEEFEESLALIQEAGLANVHLFPFSRRAGTMATDRAAAVEPGWEPLSKTEIGGRMARAKIVADRLKNEYAAQFEDQVVEGVYQGPTGDYPAHFLTENFLKIKLDRLPTGLEKMSDADRRRRPFLLRAGQIMAEEPGSLSGALL